MNLAELLLIAIGLSMDAFAVAICTGLAMPRVTIKKALIVGLYFGFFQAAMPLIGYLLGTQFADSITAFDHWIAFVLLCFIGGKMIFESFRKEDFSNKEESSKINLSEDYTKDNGVSAPETSLKPAKMLPLALATSIDALAVGVSFAFLKVDIVSSVLSIGIITFALSTVGVKVGNVFGMKFKSKAELAGGIILVLMGVKILFEHMGMLT